jgi:hypothetical protein
MSDAKKGMLVDPTSRHWEQVLLLSLGMNAAVDAGAD